MVLVQFAIHDRLDADRLARVTRLDGTTLSREVRALEQAGLVVRDARGVMRIDRFIRPHLGRYLVERELL
jgi:DNA-binding MarR family transcriptional regulator